jgi:hypothetical protein
MEPGQGLDALVAKHVLGWTDVNEQLVSPSEPRTKWAGTPPGIADYMFSKTHPPAWVPAYSTSIAAAWEVIKLHPNLDQFGDIMGDTLGMDSLYLKPAEEAARLICIVALQAVGYEIEE